MAGIRLSQLFEKYRVKEGIGTGIAPVMEGWVCLKKRKEGVGMKRLILSGLVSLLISSFAQTSFASLYDDFNDNSLDLNKWHPWTNPAPTVLLQEYGGSLNIDYSFGNMSQYGGEQSTALFGGDFDISMQFKNWAYSGNSGEIDHQIPQVGFQVAPYGKTGTDSFSIYRGTFPDTRGDQFVSNAMIGSNWIETDGEVATTDTSGYLRISRQGSTISSYYSSDNQNWNNLFSVNNAFTEPVAIGLKGYTGDYTNSLHAEWDNIGYVADEFILREGVIEEKKSGTLINGQTYNYQLKFDEIQGLVANFNVKLTGDEPIGLNNIDLRTVWKKGIEDYWNGKYEVEDNSTGKKYAIGVNLNWVESGEDIIIQVISGNGNSDSEKFYTIGNAKGQEYSMWTQERLAAHEAGHWLGLYDEYDYQNRPFYWLNMNVGPLPYWPLFDPIEDINGDGIKEDGERRTDFFGLYKDGKEGYDSEHFFLGLDLDYRVDNWYELVNGNPSINLYPVDTLGLMADSGSLRERYFQALVDWLTTATRRPFVIGQAPSYYYDDTLSDFRDDVPLNSEIPPTVPEPSTVSLLGIGLVLLVKKVTLKKIRFVAAPKE